MNAADFLLERPNDAEQVALIQAGQQLTYNEFNRRINAIAGWLASRNVRPSDRCLIVAENSFFWVATYLAIIKCGGIAVPLPPNIGETEFNSIVESTAPTTAFFSAAPLKRLAAKLPVDCSIATDRPVSPRAEIPKTIHNPDAGSEVLRRAGSNVEESGSSEYLRPGVGSQVAGHRTPPNPIATEEEILASSSGQRQSFVDFDDRTALAALMFTSGSTGQPRGVKVTHRNIIANTTSIIESLGLRPTDRVMDVLPLYYCFGLSLLHTHLRVGGSIVMDNGFMFPDRVLKNMQQTGCTVFAGVPSTFQLLLRKSSFPKMQFPTLRIVQQAGGKLADVFIDELRAATPGASVFVMYGQTEATARLSSLAPQMYAAKRGSIGKGIPGVKLTVIDAVGNPVPPGEVGQIIAEGENVTAGYWNDPAETAAVFHGAALHTGDLATVDSDGYIYVVGREREFLKLAGNRVSCQQVESVILEFPGISEAGVIGTPDDIQGEAVLLFAAHPRGEEIREEPQDFLHATIAGPSTPGRYFYRRRSSAQRVGEN